MSTRLITKEKAALLLDLSTRSIYRLMQKGVLRAEKDPSGKIRVLEEDVLQLRRVKANPPTIPLNKDSMGMVLARLQSLEAQVAVMSRILNVKYDPLNFTDPEFRFFYQMAQQYSTDGWPPHIEEEWAGYFVRMKIEDMEALERASEDPHPWRVFLRLVTTMHLNSYDKSLRDQFAAGRNNIHSLAGMWCTLKGESPKTFDLLAQRDAAPVKKLLRRLSKAQGV